MFMTEATKYKKMLRGEKKVLFSFILKKEKNFILNGYSRFNVKKRTSERFLTNFLNIAFIMKIITQFKIFIWFFLQ